MEARLESLDVLLLLFTLLNNTKHPNYAFLTPLSPPQVNNP